MFPEQYIAFIFDLIRLYAVMGNEVLYWILRYDAVAVPALLCMTRLLETLIDAGLKKVI
jgi:hypothetical protein